MVRQQLIQQLPQQIKRQIGKSARSATPLLLINKICTVIYYQMYSNYDIRPVNIILFANRGINLTATMRHHQLKISLMTFYNAEDLEMNHVIEYRCDTANQRRRHVLDLIYLVRYILLNFRIMRIFLQEDYVSNIERDFDRLPDPRQRLTELQGFVNTILPSSQLEKMISILRIVRPVSGIYS